MKWTLLFSFLFIGFLFNCDNQSEILLQEEEISIEEEPIEFELSETTSGTISLNYSIHPEFIGSILFQSQDEIVFEYHINTSRNLYPLNNEIEKWQQLSLIWDFEKSSLNVLINGQLQTTRLVKSEKITSINQFVLKPEQVKSGNSIKIKNVTYKGVKSQLPNRLKIVAFGNSTTAFRNTITQVYNQRLPGTLLERGIKNIVFNAGVGGSHTGYLADNNRHKVQHARDRFQESVLDKDPDITIICFGLNDSWIDSGKVNSRIPLEDYEKNLQFMISELKKNGIDIILMTPNAIGSDFEKWRYDRTFKYIEVVRKLADKNQLPLIDQWAIFESYASEEGKEVDDLLLDGMHPNDLWHEELANLLSDKIELIVKRDDH